MKITIFGTGYVGLVTAVCLAKVGNHICCVDVNKEKIEQLKNGICSFYEPGTSNLIEEGIVSKRLYFTTNATEAIQHGEILFIAVGTPELDNGDADLSYVFDVAKQIGKHIRDYKTVVIKSTVPVGTSNKVQDIISQNIKETGTNATFDVVFNPEFLKEGSAISDFSKPDRIIIGTNSKTAISIMKNVYAPFNRNHDKIILMDVRSAELTKYCANAMLATKISFMNEMSNIADLFEADIELVRQGIGADKRIGYDFIYPGLGYGGSCFPKDVLALIHNVKKINFHPFILESVQKVNAEQGSILLKKIVDFFGGSIQGKIFSMWGISFKPNTDDIRHSPSIKLLEAIISLGAVIRAYDPQAADNAKILYRESKTVTFLSSASEAVLGADALIIATEWEEFRSPDFDFLKKQLKHKVIFDGRNLYDPMFLKSIGLSYFCIGRRPMNIVSEV